MTEISLPDFSLVVLIGPSGAGKSSFAAKHFKATEVISSDRCRGLVADDENDQGASRDAFDLVHFIAGKRLAARRLTVVDATNLRSEDRKDYIRIARQHHALPVALVLDPGEAVCLARNKTRPDRQFGPHVVRNHRRALRRDVGRLRQEGFRQIHRFRSVEEIDAVELLRAPLWTDRRAETGPFDIIGDVHGCGDELEALLEKLGYRVAFSGAGAARRCQVVPPEGRTAVFVGDLVDRGPRIADVLRLVMAMVAEGSGLCVMGNHENKVLRWMNGRNVKPTHGLAETMAQLEAEPAAFRDEVQGFLDGLVSHYWLDGGRLAVAHAGLKAEMIGRASGAVRSFAMYGETTGETDEFGLPVRTDWAMDFRSETKVVYGHTPVPEAEWLNGTICLDTGCVFGGKLTALRWPETALVAVPAAKVYHAPVKPLAAAPERTAQAVADDSLDIEDLRGKRIVSTRLMRSVTLREANTAAALEAMSRFAINPKWLVYLPPTMSPSETSRLDGLLEHPAEAFGHFKAQGVTEVVCQEKHMGSRAVIAVCRSPEAAARRFGVTEGERGAVFTRTGRAFFREAAERDALLGRLATALETAGVWRDFETDWALLDAEIMPWSVKARSLLEGQYAPVAAAGLASLEAAAAALDQAAERGLEVAELRGGIEAKAAQLAAYRAAYRHYCWPVGGLDDYRVAPFQLLATEGALHLERDHRWHMARAEAIAASGDPIFMATAWRDLDLSDERATAAATDWWQGLTAAGGEGMVVKPLAAIARGPKGLVQPALKCRGKAYLRIIYGPEYDAPDNLVRLRRRSLGRKRALALREFALGHEALQRFVAGEPLRRVHECVFGVLALESEPVDPRL